jgi:hypothetical protein
MERQQTIEALGTSPSMVYRVRKQLVEVEAVLSRKHRAAPAVRVSETMCK